MVKNIPLTQGKVAIVDDADYDDVARYQWHVAIEGHTQYAARTETSAQSRLRITMHSHIMGTQEGRWLDHRNHNGLDNRRCNLRFCTPSQNGANRKKTTGPTASRYKGVSWHSQSNRWLARIQVDGNRISLRTHKTEEEAALAYNRAALAFFGAFAHLNDVSGK